MGMTGMSDATTSETDILSRMDDSKITKQHWKIMFISGMGFFTDAYDLFIIGVVMSILKDEWHPSPWAVGLVTSTALLAAAFGAIIFGRVADMLGQAHLRLRSAGARCRGHRVGVFARSDAQGTIGPRIDRANAPTARADAAPMRRPPAGADRSPRPWSETEFSKPH